MVEFEPIPDAGLPPNPLPPARATRASPPAVVRHAQGFARFLYSKNPFYAISAFLVLWGLWASFDRSAGPVGARAIMLGLSGYTLLLAAAGVLLIRLGQVWQDVRTVLLLVVLMFLATSVSFDETLAEDPQTGIFHIFIGLAFALVVSEAVVWGTGLRLPAWFRVPYYLLLVVFFLYPVVLSPTVHRPHDPATLWGLWGFAPVASVAMLTLLPAVRRGPEYVAHNGSPWPWPLYPWVLFGVLGFGVCARAGFLCTSLHAAKGPYSIFGAHFLVPFFLAVDVLLLEIGIVARHRGVMAVAMLAPIGLLKMAATGPAHLARDLGFVSLFMDSLGASPLFLTLAAVTGLYLVAAVRRVPWGFDALTLALIALSQVGPRTMDLDTLIAPQGWPLLAAAAVQGGMAVARRSSARCLAAALCAAFGLAHVPYGAVFTAYGGAIPLHFLLAAVLVAGAAIDDDFARFLRRIGPWLLLGVGVAGLLLTPRLPPGVPPEVGWAHGPLVAAVALVYGWALRLRRYHAAGAATLACWMGALGYRAYQVWRPLVLGLDQILLGIGFFLVAVSISLMKTGLPQAWLARLKARRRGSG